MDNSLRGSRKAIIHFSPHEDLLISVLYVNTDVAIPDVKFNIADLSPDGDILRLNK